MCVTSSGLYCARFIDLVNIITFSSLSFFDCCEKKKSVLSTRKYGGVPTGREDAKSSDVGVVL